MQAAGDVAQGIGQQSQQWPSNVTDELSSISCEPCRHKKRKCDRKVPSCSLCINSSTQCQYPEKGKRGMPVGYIIQLEDRLVEVETALFQVLANFERYKAGQDPFFPPMRGVSKAIAEHYASLSKQEKIAEWDKHNITDDSTRRQWWQTRNQQIGLNLQIDKTDLENNIVLESSIEPAAVPMHTSEPDSTANGSGPASQILERIEISQRSKYF